MIGMGCIEKISSQCRLSNVKRLLKGGVDSKFLAANHCQCQYSAGMTKLHELTREREEG